MEEEKTAVEKLDEAFNRMRAQLDYLVKAIDWQNQLILTLLAQAEVNGGNQGKRSNDKGSYRNGGASGA